MIRLRSHYGDRSHCGDVAVVIGSGDAAPLVLVPLETGGGFFVSSQPYAVRWEGTAAVAALPPEVDISNIGDIHDQLLWAVDQGADPLVVDMTETAFCDSSGVSTLVQMFRHTAAGGTPLRLVANTPAVLRVLTILGVDRLIDIYPSVAMAVAGPPGPAQDSPAAP